MIVAVKTTTMMRTTTSPISTIFGDQQRSNGSWFTLNATLHGLLVACVKHSDIALETCIWSYKHGRDIPLSWSPPLHSC